MSGPITPVVAAASDTLRHLLENVLPAAADYEAAEHSLSEAFCANAVPTAWEGAARHAKRRAAELAIAIDGLTDRHAIERGLTKTSIRAALTADCVYPGTAVARPGALDRVRGVSNAYKHRNLRDPTLPIDSENDVLAAGLGYGLDGYGVGKFAGVEMLVRERDGTVYKFLGDAPTAIAAWFRLLGAVGMELPNGPFDVCGLRVHP